MSAPAFRILKRESKEKKPSTGSGSNVASSCSDQDVSAACLSEQAYEKARAEILGQDYDGAEKLNIEEVSRPRSSRKAQYRGLDNSEFDPDYLRVSPFVVPTHQVASGFVLPQTGGDPYPSLSQVYGQAQDPPSK